MAHNVIPLKSARASAQDEGSIPINEDAVTVQAILGAASLTANQLSFLKPGQLIQLDAKVGDSLTVYVEGRLVARANVMVIGDTHLGISITEVMTAETSATTETEK